MPVIGSVFQTFKLFERLAEQDRERLLTELRRREESQSVPSAVQELEITDESHKVSEEQSSEAAKAESTSCSSSGSSSSGGGVPDQASAASKDSDQ